MPMYDYECKACGHTFETIARVDETGIECPECKATDTERLISAVQITGKAGVSYKLNKGQLAERKAAQSKRKHKHHDH